MVSLPARYRILLSVTHSPHVCVSKQQRQHMFHWSNPTIYGLPASIRVRPHSLPLSRLKPLDSLGSGDLEIGPCRSHEVVVASSPDDVRIRSISLLERVGEAGRADKRRQREHARAESLEELHVARRSSLQAVAVTCCCKVGI